MAGDGRELRRGLFGSGRDGDGIIDQPTDPVGGITVHNQGVHTLLPDWHNLIQEIHCFLDK